MYWRNVRVVPKTRNTSTAAVTPGVNRAKSPATREALRSGSVAMLSRLLLPAARSWKLMTTIWKRLAGGQSVTEAPLGGRGKGLTS